MPSLNEYTAACRSNAYQGAKFKSDIEEVIGWGIRRGLTSKTLRKVSGAVKLRIEWHERTKKRDADNIVFAKKFILDALVNMRVLPNDNRRYVKGFTDEVIDDVADFVVVELIEV